MGLVNEEPAMLRRYGPALVAFSLTIAALWVPMHTLPQHGDEAQYGWMSAYYGSELAHLDFSPTGKDIFTDPGWSPSSYWTLTQPMTARLIYALALAITESPTPAMPYSWTDPALQNPENWLEPRTIMMLRFVAVLCTATGLALIALRLGWPGLLAVALFVGIPHVRTDLPRATGEGPLVLGFGLCLLSYGSRWFPIVLRIRRHHEADGFAVVASRRLGGLWAHSLQASSRSGTAAARLVCPHTTLVVRGWPRVLN